MKKLALLILPGLFVACSDDNLTSRDVTRRTDDLIGNAVNSSADAFSAIGDLSTWQSVDRAMTALDSAFAALPPLAPTTQPAVTVTTRQVGSASGGSDAGADIITFWLDTFVFTDDNLESNTQDSATFLLHGDTFCPNMTTCVWDDATQQSVCSEGVDSDCISFIDAAEIRLVVTLLDDGVDIELQIGPNRAAPLLISLRSDEVALELDLGAAKDAIIHIASITGGSVDLPRVMTGRLRAALHINGVKDVTVSGSVLADVNIEADGASGTTSLHVAAADPLISLRAQGLIGRLTADFNAGALDFTQPYADATPALDDAPAGTLAVHLAGASYSVVLDEGMQSLTVTNIGVGNGPLTVDKDGVTIYQLDLNELSGRHLDLTITPNAAGDSALFEVSQELDVSQLFYLQLIAPDFPDVESYFMDETYRVRLYDPNGSGIASVLPIAADPMGTWAGGLKVVTGQLEISSSAAPSETVVVAEGQCLTVNAAPAAGSHPVLGALQSAACP